MSDPREVGLPPAGTSPTFTAGPEALAEVRRRRSRRRQQRLGATGAALALSALALVVTHGPGGLDDTLQQDRPAGPTRGGPASPMAAPSLPVAEPTSSGGPTVPSVQPTADGSHAPAPSAGSSARPQPQEVTPAPAANDATQVQRDEVARGLDVCRMSAQGWAATGWCFTAALPERWRAGHPVTLDVGMCRSGSDPGQVRFPSAQQAAWSITRGHKLFWSSSKQGSPFRPGEIVTVQPGRCLRWRVTWNVTSAGRAIPAGDYLLTFNNGSDLRDPSGRGYRDSQPISISS